MCDQPKPVAGLPASAPAVGGILILHQHLQGLIYPLRPPGAEVANRDSQGTPLGAMGLGEAARASPGRTAKTFNDETETEQNTKKARRSGPPREGRKGG